MKFLFSLLFVSFVFISASEYLVGVGIADITTPCVEIAFMGYAAPNQVGTGMHLRMFARAYEFVDLSTNVSFVYVSLDAPMAFQMTKLQVLDDLQKKFPGVYAWDNVILSGTHTHSTPGGIAGTALIEISTKGFSKEGFDAMVNGIVEAISLAHTTLKPGNIKIISGELDGANINRSPDSYLFDPAAERAQYEYNTEHEMTLLRLEDDKGVELGMINFFAVHGVSMNNSNTLVSSDNKGYASLLFEEMKNPGSLPGQGFFVAAFGQSNEGDSSPNTRGPSCPDGSPCDFVHSTCGGKNEGCTAKGPGADMFESTSIIAHMQFETAKKLYNDVANQVPITGKIDYRHTFVDMQSVNVSAEFSTTGKPVTTCLAALGYAFAAGTTDGPGEFDFTQGTNSTNPFWNFISSFLAAPTAEQISCQAPKPILLDVSLIKPIEWVPYILPLQIVRLGQLYIVSVPGEFTTMSGRRLRHAVKSALQKSGVWTDSTRVVIAGLANSYSHYIATYEEYQAQRYEGGSTLYGPHTLDAYLQEYSKLANDMASGKPSPVGPIPEDMRGKTFTFILPVVLDTAPLGKHFGDIKSDVRSSYKSGEIVSVSFWGANPRNDLQIGKTYLTVEKLQDDGTFIVVKTDANWETKFFWSRVLISESEVRIEWDTSAASAGKYRIRTFGVSKNLLQHLTPYSGTSSLFSITV